MGESPFTSEQAQRSEAVQIAGPVLATRGPSDGSFRLANLTPGSVGDIIELADYIVDGDDGDGDEGEPDTDFFGFLEQMLNPARSTTTVRDIGFLTDPQDLVGRRAIVDVGGRVAPSQESQEQREFTAKHPAIDRFLRRVNIEYSDEGIATYLTILANERAWENTALEEQNDVDDMDIPWANAAFTAKNLGLDGLLTVERDDINAAIVRLIDFPTKSGEEPCKSCGTLHKGATLRERVENADRIPGRSGG